jgi:hypothetical protein
VRLLALGAVLAVAVGLAVWLLRPRDEAKPVEARAAGPGELVYDTTGFEQIDALGGARHEYPARTNVSVRRSGEGCTVFRWRPLEGRIYEWELCGGDLRRFTELHRFFGNDDRRSYRCEARSSIEAGWHCSALGTTETATVVLSEPRHVRLRTVLTGKTTGSGMREVWLRADGVPLRMLVENVSATPSVLGAVHYRERYELRLRGSSPG